MPLKTTFENISNAKCVELIVEDQGRWNCIFRKLQCKL